MAAQISRVLTFLDSCAPTRIKLPSCSTCSSLAWMVVQAADFIEKQGSLVSQFHASALGRVRPGECSFFIAEQLRLDERVWNRRTGHLDPGILGAIGARMQQLGKDFLARPTLALQQNRYRRIRDPFQLLARHGHHG